MSIFDREDISKVFDAEDDVAFQTFVENTASGIALVAEPYGDHKEPVLKSDGGDFAKWLGSFLAEREF